jgi:hypothetical protein
MADEPRLAAQQHEKGGRADLDAFAVPAVESI